MTASICHIFSLILVLAHPGNAFVSSVANKYRPQIVNQSASKSAQDILNKAREKAGLPPEEPLPKIFEDDLLDDMQQVLLLLEKRVADGRGSLSKLEMDVLTHSSQRILGDMKDYVPPPPEEKKPSAPQAPPQAQTQAQATTAVPPTAVTAAPVTPQPKPTPPQPAGQSIPVKAAAPTPPVGQGSQSPQPVQAQQVTPPLQPVSASPPPQTASSGKEIRDISNDETPDFDGTGIGMPKGTRNTYVIPGMEEMSPDEYQKALQDTIVEKQKKRKAAGRYGNMGTLDYLSSLSRASDGPKGMLK